MKKLLVFLMIAILLLPSIALAEGEENAPTEETPINETQGETASNDTQGEPVTEETPVEGETPEVVIMPEETPEAGNSIVITDSNGNQYVITPNTMTETNTTEEITGETTTDELLAAIQAQGVNMSAETLAAVLTALGLDTASLTATIQAAQARPMLTTPFADYTVMEGLLLVMCVLMVIKMIFKLFAM